MKIKRINLALGAFKKQCELGQISALYYNVAENTLWCDAEPKFNPDGCRNIMEFDLDAEYFCSVFLYGMTRSLIEKIVECIRKEQ